VTLYEFYENYKILTFPNDGERRAVSHRQLVINYLMLMLPYCKINMINIFYALHSTESDWPND